MAALPYFNVRSQLKPVNRADLKTFNKMLHPTITSQPDCQLLNKLPAEIRNDIYRYVLLEEDRIRLHRINAPALLTTCRQLLKEAGSIYFGENRFHIYIRRPGNKDGRDVYRLCEIRNQGYRVKIPTWIKAVARQMRMTDIRIEIVDERGCEWRACIVCERPQNSIRVMEAGPTRYSWPAERHTMMVQLQKFLDEKRRREAIRRYPRKHPVPAHLGLEEVIDVAAWLLPPSAGDFIAS